jgi:hypothetical protein
MCLHVEGYADYTGAKRGDLLVLMLLTQLTDQTGVVVANIDQLVDDTGYPAKSIAASLRRLERMGKLRRETDDYGYVIGNVCEYTAKKRGRWHLYRVGWFNEQGEPIK